MNVKLNRGSVNVLNNILSSAGWYEGKPDVMYCAGKLLVDVFPVIGETPEFVDKSSAASIKDWLNKVFDFDLTDRQTSVIKMCLEAHLKKSQLTINPYTMALLEVFKLAPGE